MHDGEKGRKLNGMEENRSYGKQGRDMEGEERKLKENMEKCEKIMKADSRE